MVEIQWFRLRATANTPAEQSYLDGRYVAVRLIDAGPIGSGPDNPGMLLDLISGYPQSSEENGVTDYLMTGTVDLVTAESINNLAGEDQEAKDTLTAMAEVLGKVYAVPAPALRVIMTAIYRAGKPIKGVKDERATDGGPGATGNAAAAR